MMTVVMMVTTNWRHIREIKRYKVYNGLAGLSNEKKRVLSVTALMPTGRNADHRKWQYVAAMPTQAIRLTITWQRDMVVNPVGRHSGRSAFQHGAGQTHKIGIIRYRREFCDLCPRCAVPNASLI